MLIFHGNQCILLMVINMDEILSSRATPAFLTHIKPHRQLPQEKYRNPYDGLRLWSAITHGLGVLLSVLGTALLMVRTVCSGGSVWQYVSFSVYGVTMILLYTASTLYHCVNTSVSGRIALRKLDHASIYLLIAGTYTPICLVSLRGSWGWALFGVIWAFALIGLTMTAFWINAPRSITAGIYLFMGWLAVIAIYPLSQVLAVKGLFWLLTGGAMYTIGGVLYALKWPGRNNPKFGCHEIFHVFILLGSVCHFCLMYRLTAPI